MDKPSEILTKILTGQLAIEDADPAVASWARLHVYHGACEILSLPTKQQRRAALRGLPERVRPLIEQEAIRVYQLRKKNPPGVTGEG